MPSINSNTGALFSVDAARKTDREMSTAMKRLSSGERITNAGDDAAGAAISGAGGGGKSIRRWRRLRARR